MNYDAGRSLATDRTTRAEPKYGAGFSEGDPMPRHPSGRPYSLPGVRLCAQTRSALWGAAKNRLSTAAARACAARLMAPGKALETPRLAVDAMDPFQPLPVYSGAFELARSLL